MALNSVFKGQSRPETLTQTHAATNPSTTPMRPLGQPRTTLQCRIHTQSLNTTVCVQNQAVHWTKCVSVFINQ